MTLQKTLLETSSASAQKLAYVGRKPGQTPRDSDSWFTPPEYITSVKHVMGAIDLDPFSSSEANQIIQAEYYLTEKSNALVTPWNIKKQTRVFMNPPYSSGLIHKAIERFLSEFQQGHFQEGIVLVNNATDTRWFRAMVPHAEAICFTDHRISFWNSDGKRVSGNTRGQCFFYFGKNHLKFAKIFTQHGFILRHHP